MKEIELSKKKNGMAVLLLVVLLYALAIAGTVFSGIWMQNNWSPAATALMVVCIIFLCIGWFPLCGLTVLKPQEALVLTLFGTYVGTLKGNGFYYVNPFCTSVNPAGCCSRS